MNELNDREAEFADLLRRLPPGSEASVEHRDVLRASALAVFDGAAIESSLTSPSAALATKPSRPTLLRFALAAAACLIVIGLWTLLPGQRSANAFTRFADALVAARSATFKMEVKVEGKGQQSLDCYYLASGKMRNQMEGYVSIFDLKEGKAIILSPKQKTATVMNMQNVSHDPKNPQFNDFFERTREVLAESRDANDSSFTRLGEKEIDGRRALGFRKTSSAQTLTLWGDPATGLPLRVEVAWGMTPGTSVVMSDFGLNDTLNAELFDTTPPAGYKLNVIDVDMSKPTEASLVEGLRIAASLNQGEFVEKLDLASTQALVHKALAAAADKSQEASTKLMSQAFKVGRGVQFAAELPVTAEAHYAGRDVKQGAANRPIFWYKPAGQAQYRVIYADLSVQSADAAPQVEGAVRIPANTAGQDADK